MLHPSKKNIEFEKSYSYFNELLSQFYNEKKENHKAKIAQQIYCEGENLLDLLEGAKFNAENLKN